MYYLIPTSLVSTVCYCCKHFGIPKMCTFTWCTLNMVQLLAWWWLYGSKHVATFTDNKLVVFWLNFEYFNKMCFDFLKNFVLNNSHSKKKWARYDQKCLLVSMLYIRYSGHILMPRFSETWICATYFRKIITYQTSRKSVYWEPSYSMRTGGQTWWS